MSLGEWIGIVGVMVTFAAVIVTTFGFVTRALSDRIGDLREDVRDLRSELIDQLDAIEQRLPEPARREGR